MINSGRILNQTLNRQFQQRKITIGVLLPLAAICLHGLHASHHSTSTEQQMEKPDKEIVQIT